MNRIPFAFCVFWITVLTFGCSQSTVLEFTASSDLDEIPEKHQENISENLRRLFGTPVNPLQRVPDPEAEEVEETEEEEGEAQVALIDEVAREHLAHGARVYNARCAGCHGISGDGQGPAAEHLRPRPRDYRKGIFKFTSTDYGAKPARHDLVRTIRRGAKGTSMPGFPWMLDEDIEAVIDYVLFLSRRGEVEGYVAYMSQEYGEDEDIEFVEFVDAIDSSIESWAEAEDQIVVPLTPEPEYNEESVTEGRRLFLSEGCSKCHGNDGKGQVEWINPEYLTKQAELPENEREQINYDAWGEPAPAADLTARMLHGGRRPLDIYRRIYTGINGTPMPAFESVFASRPEGIWHLVHYVLHIVEGGDPAAGMESLPPVEEEPVEEEPVEEEPVEEEPVVGRDQ